MQKNGENRAGKKKLVLRRESIKALDSADLSFVLGGVNTVPPDGGTAPANGVS